MKKIINLSFILTFQLLFSQNQPFEEIKNDSIFNSKVLEIKPEFPGGNIQFLKLAMKNFQMPENFNGKILVSFVVEKDGSLSNIKTQNGNDEINAEVIRVVKLSPNWKPAKYKDKVVRSNYFFPINLNTEN